MSWSLAVLPAEIIDRVLLWEACSSPLLLWLTGNRLLQQKLKHISVVSLKNGGKYSLNRFPKFLANLGALRELSIDRDYKALLCYRTAWNTLRQVSGGANLRKLELRFQNSYQLLFPDEAMERISRQSTEDTGLSPAWCLKLAFPMLETLEIVGKTSWSLDEMDLLPPTITSLTLDMPTTTPHHTFASLLPRNLLHLKAMKYLPTSPEFLCYLPPALTSLEVEWVLRHEEEVVEQDKLYYEKVLQRLPKTLTYFQPRLDRFPYSIVHSLPSTLTQLYLYNRYEPPFDLSLREVFPQLKYFRVSSITTQAILNLPLTIENLQCEIAGSDIEGHMWPKNLRELTLDKLSENTPTRHLPPNLCRFAMGSGFISPSDVSLLSRGLTSLSIQWLEHQENIDFPPHLTSLRLDSQHDVTWVSLDSNQLLPAPSSTSNADPEKHAPSARPTAVPHSAWFPLECVPRTVTDLRLTFVLPASKLRFLPPRLKKLILEDIVIDDDFDALKEVEAVHRNFEVGRDEGIEELFDWTQLDKASVATLLPRTLKHWELTGNALLAEEFDWKHMPPTLHSFLLYSEEGLSGDAMRSIPNKHLRTLFTNAKLLTEEDIKALPSTIPALTLQLHDAPVTPAIVSYLPTGVYHIASTALSQAISALNSKRDLHSLDDDPTEFIRLMTPGVTL